MYNCTIKKWDHYPLEGVNLTSAKEIYEIALRLVKKYNTRDPEQIADYLGIKVFYSDELGDLLGLYTYMIKNRVIILNSKLSDFQKIMVLAHEIGHDRLHRQYAKTGLQEYQIFDMRSPSEYEANAFAAHFLIDTDELIGYMKDYDYDPWSLAGCFNVNVNLILIKMQELNRMGYKIRIPMDPNPQFFKNETPDGPDEWTC